MALTAPVRAQDDYIYWVDEEEQEIWRGHPDGSAIKPVVSRQLPVAIAITGDTLFWIDKASQAIFKRVIGSNIDDTLISNLSFNRLSEPTSLVIDSTRRIMYWINEDSTENAYRYIYRSDLDDNDSEIIISDVTFPRLPELALDLSTGDIYWAEIDVDGSSQRILRADSDGSNKEMIVDGLEIVADLAVDSEDQKLYWIDRRTQTIQRISLNGGEIDTLVTGVRPLSLALNTSIDKLYFDDGSRLQQADLDGSNIQTVLSDLPEPVFTLALPSKGEEVFLLQGELYPAQIMGAKLDTDTIREVVAGIGFLASVTVDTTNQKIYVTGSAGELLRANLDGTEIKTVLHGNCGTGAVTDVALDLKDEVIYWGRLGDCGRSIGRANLDGTDVGSVLIHGHEQASFITLDLSAEHIYMSFPTYEIVRVDSDGSDFTIIREGHACGTALDLTNNKIYWASCHEGGIHRANLDGSEAESVLSGLNYPYGLAIDVSSNLMYWSERDAGKIRRATFDGENVTDLFTGLTAPGRIALSFGTNTLTATDPVHPLPSDFSLRTNYPNPFSRETVISFALPEAADVSLIVFDILGRQIAQVADGWMQAGEHKVMFDASHYSSGVYFYHFQADEYVKTRKMVVVK